MRRGRAVMAPVRDKLATPKMKTVFLSSVARGLEEYRKAALAISAHAHIEPGVIAKILTKLAQVDKNIRHDYQAAEQDYYQLLAAVQSDPPAYLQTLVELAEMETKLHKYTEAQSYFEQASAYCMSEKSLPQLNGWQALVGLGNLFMEKKDWPQASRIYHNSYEFARLSKDKGKTTWMVRSLMVQAQAVAAGLAVESAGHLCRARLTEESISRIWRIWLTCMVRQQEMPQRLYNSGEA